MPVEAKNSKFFYIFNSPIILHFRQDFPLGPVLLLLNNPKPIPSWSLLRELVSQADGQLLFQGSGKIWTVFQIACQRPLLAGEAPQSTGRLKGPMWVGQKVAAVHHTETQLAQDEVSNKAKMHSSNNPTR